jgi:hypothetical protein
VNLGFESVTWLIFGNNASLSSVLSNHDIDSWDLEELAIMGLERLRRNHRRQIDFGGTDKVAFV